MKALLLAGIAAAGLALTGCDTYTTVDRGYSRPGYYGGGYRSANVYYDRDDYRYSRGTRYGYDRGSRYGYGGRRDVSRVNVYERNVYNDRDVNRRVVIRDRDGDRDRRNVSRVNVRDNDENRRTNVNRTVVRSNDRNRDRNITNVSVRNRTKVNRNRADDDDDRRNGTRRVRTVM